MSLRIINTHFWDDNYIIYLKPYEKLLFLYFLSSPLCNLAGVYEISIKRISFDTGLNSSTIEKILSKFEKDKKIYYRYNFIFIVNHKKNQKINPSMEKHINSLFSSFPQHIIDFFNSISTTCRQPVDSLSTDCKQPDDNLQQSVNSLREEEEEEEEEEKEEDESESESESEGFHNYNSLPKKINQSFWMIKNTSLNHFEYRSILSELNDNNFDYENNLNIILESLESWGEYQDDSSRKTFKYLLGIIRGKKKDLFANKEKKRKQDELKQSHKDRLLESKNEAAEKKKIETETWKYFNDNKSKFPESKQHMIIDLIQSGNYISAQSKIYQLLDFK